MNSSVVALMASSAFLFGSAATLNLLNQQLRAEGVVVPIAPWTWISQMKLGVDQAPLPAVLSPEVAATLNGIQPVPSVIPKKTKFAKRTRATKNHIAVRSLSAKNIDAKGSEIASARVASLPASEQTVTTQPVAPATSQSNPSEHERMQKLYVHMRVQFFAALGSPQKVTTQALASVTSSEMETSATVRPEPLAPQRELFPLELSAAERGQNPQDAIQGFKVLARKSRGTAPVAKVELDQVHQDQAAPLPAAKVEPKMPTAAVTSVGGAVRLAQATERNEKAASDYSSKTVTTQPVATVKAVQPKAAATKSTDDVKAQPETQSLVPAQPIDEKFVEAFTQNVPLMDVQSTRITREDTTLAGQTVAGWSLAKAEDHWPTLYRIQGSETPLISFNSIMLLKSVARDVTTQASGVVFGKVPAGWSVSLAGHDQRPVMLNTHSQPISHHVLEGERTFLFINVAPGSYLLQLSQNLKDSEAGIAVPVMAGVSSYLDLTRMAHQSVKGTVLDGILRPTVGWPKVVVRAVGNDASATISAADGRFTLENIVTVGDYPVVIETEYSEGYMHRYQISPSRLKDLKLVQAGPEQVEAWVQQLDGGVHPSSGVILLGTKKPAAKVISRKVLNTQTLDPETYALDGEGFIHQEELGSIKTQRYVSVQTPEGPVVTEVLNSKGAVVWSELSVSSPQVISVVGTDF